MTPNQFSEDPDLPEFRKAYNDSNDGNTDDEEEEVTGTEVTLIFIFNLHEEALET